MWLSVNEFGDVFVREKLKPNTLDPKLWYTLRNKVVIAQLFRCAGRVPHSTPVFNVLVTPLLNV